MQNVVKPTPLIKPCMILGVTLFWLMMGKSSWVPSRTQGLFLTCCRWYGVPWLLQELLLSSYGRGVRPRARPFCVVLPMMLLSDLILNWHVFEPCVWWWFQNYIASAIAIELGIVITIFELWCMLRYLWTYVTCGLYVESCMIFVVWLDFSRSFMILDGLPGLYGLKYDSVIASVVAIILVLL